MVFRDLPDVFAGSFERECAANAAQLRETARCAAMVGYFLQNEPTWSFAEVPVAAGMLLNTESAASRDAFARFLAERHQNDAGLAVAWGEPVTLEQVRRGRWRHAPPPAAARDLDAFSAAMIDRFFSLLSSACRSVDPTHLNLGCRFAGMPTGAKLDAMRHVDVISVNLYKRDLARPDYVERLTADCALIGKPMLSGEWHFGSLDAGLPGVANQSVVTHADRAAAFRVYQESAAALPCCVGSHYFRLCDNPALGRNDGENYNIGFLDVCCQSYADLLAASRLTHDRIYDVAAGRIDRFNVAPVYLGIQGLDLNVDFGELCVPDRQGVACRGWQARFLLRDKDNQAPRIRRAL